MNNRVTNFFQQLTRIERSAAPPSLNASLREYQLQGFQWALSNLLNGFGVILADDMGLGKTVQAISVLLALRERQLLDKVCIFFFISFSFHSISFFLSFFLSFFPLHFFCLFYFYLFFLFLSFNLFLLSFRFHLLLHLLPCFPIGQKSCRNLLLQSPSRFITELNETFLFSKNQTAKKQENQSPKEERKLPRKPLLILSLPPTILFDPNLKTSAKPNSH